MIEFQYFDGCPNAKATLNNLMEVGGELRIDENDIRIIQVPNIESAEKNGFQGSPTILVNGVDIYTDSEPFGYNYSCRIYSFDGEQTGIIPKEYIRQKIKNYNRDRREGSTGQ
jgi:hypothetical protein